MKKFYVFNAGCIRRGIDSMWIQNYLQHNDWIFTRNPKNADLIVIATCGVVRENERKSLKAVEWVCKKSSRYSKIVITGCLPNINPEAIHKLGNFIFVPTGDIHKLDEIINPQIKLCDIEQPNSVTEGRHIIDYLVARSFCRKSRFYRFLFWKFGMNINFLTVSLFVKKVIEYFCSLFHRNLDNKTEPYFNISIARGCKSECTYCATKIAIGGLRSRPPEEIINQFKYGLEKGYRIIQLISEDTGCYGLDIGTNMPNLLRQLFSLEGNYKINIIDFHPRWLIMHYNDIIPIMIKNQDKIKDLFIPIQSGSDRMLRLMKRDHTIVEIKPILKELIKKAPHIAVRTSVMVGFPGESNEDFKATVELIKDINFAEVTINRYEDRPNTASSKMDNKIPQETIEKRGWYLVEKLNCNMLS